jgi:pyruvate-ferredoxin/flavodoxin oxidoreductase
MKAYPEGALVAAPDGFQRKEPLGRGLEGMRLSVQVAPDDCTGCTLCVTACPAVSRTDPTRKALRMIPADRAREAERPRWDFFSSLPDVSPERVRLDTVKGSQLMPPLFEFSGACSGCGETPYLKLLTQLVGDRLLVANATGCSSIFGGNLPTTPWSANAEGRGPAWANSLFEDNAEFGLGMRVALDRERGRATRLLRSLADRLDADLVEALLAPDSKDATGLRQRRESVSRLRERLASFDDPVARELGEAAEAFLPKTVWIVGGDGWAYDIGFGGLDHVLASGRDVNVLVLDTEVYSNTGGQSSKATPRGAVAKFAAAGKRTAKKDLGLFAMQYPGVYVAQIAFGANDQQTVSALAEAERHDGPSLVIAYAHCIAQGFDLSEGIAHQKDAVATGHWPLYRRDPARIARGEAAVRLDSKAPTKPLAELEAAETRFTTTTRKNGDLSKLAQSDALERWERLARMAGANGSRP